MSVGMGLGHGGPICALGICELSTCIQKSQYKLPAALPCPTTNSFHKHWLQFEIKCKQFFLSVKHHGMRTSLEDVALFCCRRYQWPAWFYTKCCYQGCSLGLCHFCPLPVGLPCGLCCCVLTAILHAAFALGWTGRLGTVPCLLWAGQ